MGRERRTAARAIGNDLVPLIKKPLFVDLFQRPPLRFDIVVVISDVGIVHIAPIAHAVRHLLPFVRILPDGFFAFADERFDAVCLDLRLMVESELLFHFQLDGKPVRIPARFSQNVHPLHRLIAGDDVLHHAGENVPDMRFAVGRGRTVVKGKLLLAFVLLHAVFKDVILVPILHHSLLPVYEVQGSVYFFIE